MLLLPLSCQCVKNHFVIAKLLISNSTESRIREIQKVITDAKLTAMHPDLLYFSSDSKLGITEARKIKEHFSLKPYSGKGRAVVLEDASQLTDEAQNALLKTLEELPEYALFILGADSDSKLLPTIISRCQVERLQATGDSGQGENYKEDIENLLNSTVEQRFEYIEKLKDREEFLHSLLEYFHQTLILHPRGGNVNPDFLKELLQAEQWQNQNVNIRAILEYLMLSLPSKV